jgi:hypothetical protein
MLAIAVPVAFATFTDVPPSNPFYDDINAIQGAGITSGCGGGNFCPTDNITRQAEAAFVHRAGARVANGSYGNQDLTTAFADLGVLTINTGGVAGHTGFVKIDANPQIFTFGSTGCPCVGEFRLLEDGVGDITPDHNWTQINEVSSAGYAIDAGSLTTAVAVPTATTVTFRIQGALDAGTAATTAFGEWTLTYVPFGSTGADTLGPTTTKPTHNFGPTSH